MFSEQLRTLSQNSAKHVNLSCELSLLRAHCDMKAVGTDCIGTDMLIVTFTAHDYHTRNTLRQFPQKVLSPEACRYGKGVSQKKQGNHQIGLELDDVDVQGAITKLV